jgi:hypothetical protein
MAKTVVALYDDFMTARRVVENLTEVGFSRDTISVMVNDASGEYAGYLRDDRDIAVSEDVKAGDGAGFGAVVGTLIGLGAALIPGIGPVIGAGPLGVALTAGVGAAAGAITGGITAAMIDMGIDEDDASIYAEGVRRGSTLVSITTHDEWVERAEDIMNRYEPIDIDERSTLWREGGWKGFSSESAPYSSSQIEQERLAYRHYDVPHGMGTTQSVENYSDQERRASLQPTGTSASAERMNEASLDTPGHSAAPMTDYDTTSGGRAAAQEATEHQNRSLDEKNVSPPGAERHHETSQHVDQAMAAGLAGSQFDAAASARRVRTYARRKDGNP